MASVNRDVPFTTATVRRDRSCSSSSSSGSRRDSRIREMLREFSDESLNDKYRSCQICFGCGITSGGNNCTCAAGLKRAASKQTALGAEKAGFGPRVTASACAEGQALRRRSSDEPSCAPREFDMTCDDTESDSDEPRHRPSDPQPSDAYPCIGTSAAQAIAGDSPPLRTGPPQVLRPGAAGSSIFGVGASIRNDGNEHLHTGRDEPLHTESMQLAVGADEANNQRSRQQGSCSRHQHDASQDDLAERAALGNAHTGLKPPSSERLHEPVFASDVMRCPEPSGFNEPGDWQDHSTEALHHRGDHCPTSDEAQGVEVLHRTLNSPPRVVASDVTMLSGPLWPPEAPCARSSGSDRRHPHTRSRVQEECAGARYPRTERERFAQERQEEHGGSSSSSSCSCSGQVCRLSAFCVRPLLHQGPCVDGQRREICRLRQEVRLNIEEEHRNDAGEDAEQDNANKVHEERRRVEEDRGRHKEQAAAKSEQPPRTVVAEAKESVTVKAIEDRGGDTLYRTQISQPPPDIATSNGPLDLPQVAEGGQEASTENDGSLGEQGDFENERRLTKDESIGRGQEPTVQKGLDSRQLFQECGRVHLEHEGEHFGLEGERRAAAAAAARETGRRRETSAMSRYPTKSGAVSIAATGPPRRIFSISIAHATKDLSSKIKNSTRRCWISE